MPESVIEWITIGRLASLCIIGSTGVSILVFAIQYYDSLQSDDEDGKNDGGGGGGSEELEAGGVVMEW